MKRKKDEKPDDDNGFAEFGGYMAAKIAKLEDQFKKDAANIKLKSNLFEGISIFVNGYTRPSPEELKMIMAENGGVFHTYQRSWTSYVVANNLPDVKIRALGKDKVIKADWIVDSLKAGKLLDYSHYLLYNEKSSQPSLYQFGQKKEKEEVTENSMKVEEKPGGVNELQLNLLCEALMNESSNDSKTHKTPPKSEPAVTKAGPSKCATDPGFLKEFFKKSRLHHIATLGANFKQYVTDLRKKHSGGFPLRSGLIENVKKRAEGVPYEKSMIMHIDMDCFFVSVGIRKRPDLRGKPVAVTHSMGSEGGNISHRPGANRELEADLYRKRLEERYQLNEKNQDQEDTKLGKRTAALKDGSSLAEIASCSYEARKFGIRNGMFVGPALKLCPDLQTIPYEFEEYQKVAKTLYSIIAQYTLDIEAVSCDEMYVDLSELLISTKLDVLSLVTYIRDEVKNATGCPCSVGLGKNKLQARLATKEAKPDGQFLMENIDEYIKSLAISELPGVGTSTSYKLEKIDGNLKTCGDLQNLSLPKLHLEFGKKFGESLYQFCRGIDPRPLQLEHVRQSISVDVNYGIRFTAHSEVEFFLGQIAEELHERMDEIHHRGKKLTLKILIRAKDAPVETAKYLGTGLCDAVNRTNVLTEFTCDTNVIREHIIKMYRDMNLPPHELRGIGVQMSKLDSSSDGANNGMKVNRIMEMFKNAPAKTESPKQGTSKMAVTPQKVEIQKNEIKLKQDHIKKLHKTPQKRRGRPPKSGFKTPVKTNFKGTLPNIFSKVTSSSSKANPSDEPDLTGLDQEFLSALPDDIRQEVIRDHQRLLKQEKIQFKSESSIIDDESTTMSVDSVSVSVQSEPVSIEVEEKSDSDNIFLRNDFILITSNWISVTEKPEESDLEVMKWHINELINQRNLSPVYLALKFLLRKIGDLECSKWHWFYRTLLKEVQTSMLVQFNRVMDICDLDCQKCNLC
uniref:DNA repair protein REV1 n=1 Tax=Culicoides sonorensis TaxID=179676 RepID=A0A336KCQ3_CULSO